MGPKLFLLYLYDVDSILPRDCSGYFYCDDGTVAVSGRNDCVLNSKCQLVLDNLNYWFAEHSLYLNAEETQIIRFHCYQNRVSQLDVDLDGVDVPGGGAVRFLGVTMDETLDWKEHCRNLISKLHSVAYQFRNLKQVLNEKDLVAIYYANCESRLRYGVGLWGWSPSSGDVFLA